MWNHTSACVRSHMFLCTNPYIFHFYGLLVCQYSLILTISRRRTMKKATVLATVAGTTLACVGTMFAQAPVVNIDRYRNGNLASAQSSIVQAYQSINQAQQRTVGQR